MVTVVGEPCGEANATMPPPAAFAVAALFVLAVVAPFAAEASTNADSGCPPKVCASPAVNA